MNWSAILLIAYQTLLRLHVPNRDTDIDEQDHSRFSDTAETEARPSSSSRNRPKLVAKNGTNGGNNP